MWTRWVRLGNPASRRVGMGFVDQALSSLTNFALAAIVARSVDPAAFGAFSLVFVTYTIVMNLSRSACTDPLVIVHSASEPEAVRPAVAAATGATLLVGSALAVVGVGLALEMHGALRLSVLFLAMCLPGLLLQDAWRWAFFAQGRSGSAAANDLAWAVLQVITIAGLVVSHVRQPGWYVLAWGAAATGAAIVGIVQTGLVPRPDRALWWWRQQRRLSLSSTWDTMATTVTSQASIFALTAFAGVASVGAVRGAVLLFGPVILIYQGCSLVSVPEGARLYSRNPERIRPAMLGLSSALVGLAGVWTLVALLLPHRIGTSLLGATWPSARRLILPTGLGFMAQVATAGASSGIRVMQHARRILVARLACSPFVLAGGVGGALIGGATGYVVGNAVAYVFMATIYWYHFRASMTEPPGSQEAASARSRRAVNDG